MNWRFVTGVLAAVGLAALLLLNVFVRVTNWLRFREQRSEMPASSDMGLLARVVYVSEGFAASVLAVAGILGLMTLMQGGLSWGYVAALLGVVPAFLLISATGDSRQRRMITSASRVVGDVALASARSTRLASGVGGAILLGLLVAGLLLLFPGGRSDDMGWLAWIWMILGAAECRNARALRRFEERAQVDVLMQARWAWLFAGRWYIRRRQTEEPQGHHTTSPAPDRRATLAGPRASRPSGTGMSTR